MCGQLQHDKLNDFRTDETYIYMCFWDRTADPVVVLWKSHHDLIRRTGVEWVSNGNRMSRVEVA